MKANKWILESDEKLRRRLGKLGEELGELIAIKDRCLIQGVGESCPKSGKLNYSALFDECADVSAQLELLHEYLDFNPDAFNKRKSKKKQMMESWESQL